MVICRPKPINPAQDRVHQAIKLINLIIIAPLPSRNVCSEQSVAETLRESKGEIPIV
jgi:hypothetical protein